MRERSSARPSIRRGQSMATAILALCLSGFLWRALGERRISLNTCGVICLTLMIGSLGLGGGVQSGQQIG